MIDLHYGNAADEVVHALTAGPTPGVQDWEVEESSYDDHGASALVIVNGQTYHLRVTPVPAGE